MYKTIACRHVMRRTILTIPFSIIFWSRKIATKNIEKNENISNFFSYCSLKENMNESKSQVAKLKMLKGPHLGCS